MPRHRLAAVAAMGAAPGPAIAAPPYHFTSLGDLPGGDDRSIAYAINNAGQVAGFGTSAAGERAVLWRNGTVTELGGLSGGVVASHAADINGRGLIVGVAAASGVLNAFLLTPVGPPEPGLAGLLGIAGIAAARRRGSPPADPRTRYVLRRRAGMPSADVAGTAHREPEEPADLYAVATCQPARGVRASSCRRCGSDSA